MTAPGSIAGARSVAPGKHGRASLASGNLLLPPPHPCTPHLRQQHLRFCRSRADLESDCCSSLPSGPQLRAPSSIRQTMQCPPHQAVCFHLRPVESVSHTAGGGGRTPSGQVIALPSASNTSLPHPEESSFSRGTAGFLSLLPSQLHLLIHRPITPSAPSSQALTVPHTHKQRTHLRTFALTLTSAPNASPARPPALQYPHSSSLASLRFSS